MNLQPIKNNDSFDYIIPVAPLSKNPLNLPELNNRINLLELNNKNNLPEMNNAINLPEINNPIENDDNKIAQNFSEIDKIDPSYLTGPDQELIPISTEMESIELQILEQNDYIRQFEEKLRTKLGINITQQPILTLPPVDVTSPPVISSPSLCHPIIPKKNVITIGNVSIYDNDLTTLLPKKWFSDAIIDGYIQLISERQEHCNDNIVNFGTYFLYSLKKGLENIQKYENSSMARFMIFPRCIRGHWSLIAADRKKNMITLYDSLHYFQDINDLDLICTFLNRVDNMYNNVAKQPWKYNTYILHEKNMQYNFYDCGPYVCTFVDYLSREKTFDFKEKDMCQIRKEIKKAITSKIL